MMGAPGAPGPIGMSPLLTVINVSLCPTHVLYSLPLR